MACRPWPSGWVSSGQRPPEVGPSKTDAIILRTHGSARKGWEALKELTAKVSSERCPYAACGEEEVDAHEMSVADEVGGEGVEGVD